MTDEEKKFLEENFKAGEYTSLTILVKNDELNRFIAYLKNANLHLAVFPGAADKVANPTDKDTKH